MKSLRFAVLLTLVVLIAVPFSSIIAQDTTEITFWYHSGQGAEREDFEAAVDEFNASQDAIFVNTEPVSQATYHDELRAASLSGTLPCVVEVDGQMTQAFAAAGDFADLSMVLNPEFVDDFLPSIIRQGTYEDGLYSVGMYDSGLALWGNRALLEEAGVRIPTGTDDNWTFEEFNDALAALSMVVPEDGYAIDTKGSDAGWYFYVLTPILWSFGGDVIDREDWTNGAEGLMNGPEALAFGQWYQSLFDNGYSVAEPVDGAEDFRQGKVGLSMPGHWMYRSYKEALGDDLVLIPMPTYGDQPYTGMGSWAITITNTCEEPDAAAEFLEFWLSPERVESITTANGAPPARVSVLEQSELYAEGGDLYVFTQQINAGWSYPRPGNPVTPAIQSAWGTAIEAIRAGEDVQTALDTAVDEIDAAIANYLGE